MLSILALALLAVVGLLHLRHGPESGEESLMRLRGKWDCIDVLGGEYRVCNNVWGSGPGVGEQVLGVDPSSTYFKVIRTTHRSQGVAAYPFIYKGCHWGHCTKGSVLPLQVDRLKSAESSWAIEIGNAEGTWNAAYDLWFSIRGASEPTGGAELMIWINYGGGARPAGVKTATVVLNDAAWDVYFAKMDWNYVAYFRVEPIDRVELNLKEFINDAVQRGYVNPSWYLDAVEAGFEIWSYGQGLTTLYFTVRVAGE